MLILLLGKNGQVGFELRRSLMPLGTVKALGRDELDLTDQQAIRHAVRTLKPDLIVNAAAYTAVDRAEEEPELAMAVNGLAPGILAEEAVLLKARLVHYSTDYVFDGTNNKPYSEHDTLNPINTYGKTKLAGEEAIRLTGVEHLILRTSWVYGLRGNNFLLTILRLAGECEEISIVDDQYGSPTWCRQIADATALLIDKCFFQQKSDHGLYHLTAAGKTSWFGFARSIINLALLNGRLKREPRLSAISTEQYPTKALRPRYSVLDNSLLKRQYDIALPGWQQQLGSVF